MHTLDPRNEQAYLSRFNSFFSSERLSSTYKPVFLKSLIPISEYTGKSFTLVGSQWIQIEDETLRVDLNFVAIRYIQFYWELYFKFKLKQSHLPRDANINRILEKVKNDLNESNTVSEIGKKDRKVPDMKTLASEHFTNLRKEVIRYSIMPEVLVHLDPRQELYRRVRGENYILLNLDIVAFFAKYKGIMIPALNYMITRYLENINFIPRIAEKVSENIPRSFPDVREKNIILNLQKSCFYCPNTWDKHSPRYDHVIPFNYIYQTELFNIVAACSKCNSSKNDRLPSGDLFERVKDRNKKLYSQRLIQEDYNDEGYQKLYDACINAYHGTRPFFKGKWNLDICTGTLPIS